VVSVATVLDVAEGVCRDARIVLGAVASMPYRAVAAEDVVRGGPLDESRIVQAAEAALRDAKPMSGNAYKVEIAKTLIRRMLRL
jgi:xanthine dehydrogenase YagS FAD-binding subunit